MSAQRDPIPEGSGLSAQRDPIPEGSGLSAQRDPIPEGSGLSAQRWWPSRYGAADQAGALNEITPASVRTAAALVREGRVYDLAHVLHADVPAFPGRTFRQTMEPSGHDGLGRNRVNWVIERVVATQQMGTHLDGLNHLHVGDRTYNGHALGDILTRDGTARLGIDTLPQIVTRGLLVDVEAARGPLGPGDVLTPEDVKELDVRPGDAVLFHTGWGRKWGVDNAAYAAGEPGPGMDLARWIAEHRISVTGCDTWSFGPVPPEDPDEPFVVPQTLNTHHGVIVAENLYLSELARDGVVEFLLVISHPKLRGATGAWVAPLAIV
jgi:kynurenine formamidase